MAESKKSFVFYVDWFDTFKVLPDDKAGELIKHVLSYVNDENPETEDILINAVFANIKNTLKRDLNKWDKIKEKRSEAGKISAEKRRKNKQNSTKATSVKFVENNLTNVNKAEQTPTNSTVSVNDNVNVNVNVNDNVNVILFLKNILLAENQKISTIKSLKAIGYNVVNYENYVENFILKLIADDDFHKNKIEIKKHFNNWLKLELKNKPKKSMKIEDTKKDMAQNL